MATQTSILNERWRAHNDATLDAVKKACLLLESGSLTREVLDQITIAVRNTIATYDEPGDLRPDELISVALHTLRAAESVRELLDRAQIPVGDTLRTLYDQLADNAECLAISAEGGWEEHARDLRAEQFSWPSANPDAINGR